MALERAAGCVTTANRLELSGRAYGRGCVTTVNRLDGSVVCGVTTANRLDGSVVERAAEGMLQL